MKKNVVKNIIKMVATTAMVIGIAATAKVDANAMTIKEFAKLMGMTEAEVKNDSFLMETYYDGYDKESYASAKAWLDGVMGDGDVSVDFTASTATSTTATAGTAVDHKELLEMINKDRRANGAGSLVWSDDLAVIAQQRAVEMMASEHTAEMQAAIAANDYATQCAISHSGMRKGTSENMTWVPVGGSYSNAEINAEWINSAGHHRNRIKAGWTQYAAASYIDPATMEEIWVEVFADNSFKGVSSFDYIRYATDYPDLAAAFGQNRNALYNHYLTNGRIEGRKAYYTDGTLIK